VLFAKVSDAVFLQVTKLRRLSSTTDCNMHFVWYPANVPVHPPANLASFEVLPVVSCLPRSEMDKPQFAQLIMGYRKFEGCCAAWGNNLFYSHDVLRCLMCHATFHDFSGPFHPPEALHSFRVHKRPEGWQGSVLVETHSHVESVRRHIFTEKILNSACAPQRSRTKSCSDMDARSTLRLSAFWDRIPRDRDASC
jgi:hypothetical protein